MKYVINSHTLYRNITVFTYSSDEKQEISQSAGYQFGYCVFPDLR